MSKLHKGVLITVMATAAAILGSCDDEATGSWRVCSNSQGQRVPDADCAATGEARPRAGIGASGAAWVYYTRARGVPRIGEPTAGASPRPAAGGNYGVAPEGGISRGGFGGTGEGHAGGGGEGGGHGGGGGE